MRPGRRNRWLGAALVVSLALNAFFVGAVATDMVRVKWWDGDRDARALRFQLRWLEGRLDPAALAEVEVAVSGARPDVAAHVENLRRLRTELAALAAVPEPDRAAIDAQLAAIRAEVVAMQLAAQTVTMDALLALSPKERAGLAEAQDR